MKDFIFSILVILEISIPIFGSLTEDQLVVLPNRVNYEEATNLCEAKGMSLIKVEDVATNRLVYWLAKTKQLGNYWLDGNDKVTEGNWVYNDGTKIIYSQWRSNQPDNYNDEDCLHGIYEFYGLWNDINCNNTLAVICKAHAETNQFVALQDKVSYEMAINICKRKGMSLVKVKDDETNKLVYRFAVEEELGNYWLDGNDRVSEGNWEHNDGTKIIYSNWRWNQPDNYNDEDCLHGIYDQQGLWNDIKCDDNLAVICATGIPLSPEERNQFVVFSNKMTYEAATNICKENAMNLVKVEDWETNQLVYRLAIEMKLGDYWLDGNDRTAEGNWEYNNGTKITYSEWRRNQPDNYHNEDCLHGSYNRYGLWNDIKCDDNLAVICHKEMLNDKRK